MRLIHLAAAALLVGLGAVSAVAQDREDILRCRAIAEDIRRLGCYDRLRLPEPAAGSGKYETISLAELKSDVLGYRGSLVEVAGRLLPQPNGFLLAADADDASPLPVDIRALSRLQRQSIAEACGAACRAVVRGAVKPVAFTTGIVADSVSVE